MASPQYSADRHYWWDGKRWVTVSHPGMLWFTHTPDWLAPVVLMSLIGFIPLFGFFFSFGWLLAARDSLRQGVLQVPPASFSYFRRGVNFFVPFLFYVLAWCLVALILTVFDALLLKSGHAVISVNVIFLFSILLLLVLAVLFFYTFAAILTIADSRGIWATFRPRLVWRTATGSSSASWRFAATYLLGLVGLIVAGMLLPGFSTLITLCLSSVVFLMTAPALAEVILEPVNQTIRLPEH